MNSILKNKVNNIIHITNGNICNSCLGRYLSEEVAGDTNQARGSYIRECLQLEDQKGYNCEICHGILGNLEKISDDVQIKIQDIEYSNFLVGCRLPPEIMKIEDELVEKLGLDVESIKKEFNRELGKILYFKLGKDVEFDSPELVIMVDIAQNDINLQINPLFIEGRYRKLVRGIPQTKWPCRKCKGKGCEYCNHTGKMYQLSVEELISPEVLKMVKGTGSKFHGAGREDIDVKMLGSGRPFVLEIKEPKKRDLNLKDLEKKINSYANGKVQVLELCFTIKERKAAIKSSSTDTHKTYRALVKLEGDVEEDDIIKLKELNLIKQRTPVRVSHRRADKIRERRVKNLKTIKLDSKTLELEIICEGGLYIKELISGDENRTQPNVSSLLGMGAKCIELDVIDVNL